MVRSFRDLAQVCGPFRLLLPLCLPREEESRPPPGLERSLAALPRSGAAPRLTPIRPAQDKLAGCGDFQLLFLGSLGAEGGRRGGLNAACGESINAVVFTRLWRSVFKVRRGARAPRRQEHAAHMQCSGLDAPRGAARAGGGASSGGLEAGPSTHGLTEAAR